MLATVGAAAIAALLAVSGCATASHADGANAVRALLAQRDPAAAGLGADPAAVAARVQELLSAPLTRQSAVALALLHSPRITALYSGLDIAAADVIAASRIDNPVLAGSNLSGGGERQWTLGMSASLTDLLLLSSRRRLSHVQYERSEQAMGAAVLTLLADVEIAWFDYVDAEQVASMRAAVVRAANASAATAQRFLAAGNESELQLLLEQSAASEARIAAVRADSAATRAKLVLHGLMGLEGPADWQAAERLPAPPAADDDLESLVLRARAQRLDLASARREAELLGAALELAERWRWVGAVTVGVERERETDTTRVTGPTLEIALPIFNQGQAGIARATAELSASRAHLATLAAAVDNGVRLAHARVAAARQLVDEYAMGLVPERAAIVEQQQRRQSYMLIGVFELLLAKQQQYDGTQGYLEALRDYWSARVELARQVGGSLPSDSEIGAATIGIGPDLVPSAH